MHAAVLRIKPRRSLVVLVVAAVAMVATMVVLARQAEAAITNNFSVAYSTQTNGAILLRGNTNLVCPASADCTSGQNGTASPSTLLDNNNYQMINNDTDGDASTFNNSSATVTLPQGSSVLFAGLYWSGDTAAPSSGAGAAAAPNAGLKNQVKFRTPATGASSWIDLTADTVFLQGSLTAYQGFEDVTPQVSGAGSGVYTVANIQAGIGQDRYAGWALVIAYHDNSQRMRSLNIWNGFGVVKNGDISADIPVSGFQTPPTGNVGAAIGTVVYEGDRGKIGDALQVHDGTQYQTTSDGKNAADNIFNSTVTEGGASIGGRSPNNDNLMGVDIDRFDTVNKFSNGQTSTTLHLTTASSNGETYYPGVVTLAIDLLSPNLIVTPTATDLNGPDLVPGDTVEYRLDVRNDGTDTANGIVLADVIPPGTTYVGGSLKIAGAAVTDANDADAGKLDSGAPTFDLGSLAPTATTYVTYRVRVDNSAQPGDQITDNASSSYTAAYNNAPGNSVPSSITKTVLQPHADLAAGLTVAPSPVQRTAPGSVNYTATVTNNGGDLEPYASLKVTLPTGVTPGSVSGCTTAGQDVTCPVGAVDANSSVTRIIPAVVSGAPATIRLSNATVVVSGSGIDGTPANNTTTATLTVNTAPVAVADPGVTTNNATPVTIDVENNDSDDAPKAALTVQVVQQAAHGLAQAQANGTVIYTPDSAWMGPDTFTYKLVDADGGSSNTVTVSVTTANGAPVANDDNYSTAGVAKTVSPIDNDTDPNTGQTRSITAIGQPQAGAGTTALNVDGTVTYTPAARFHGTANFTYTIEDSAHATATGTVHIAVTNAAPVAMDDTDTVAYHAAVTIDVLANDTDDNGDTLTIASVGTAGHGTAGAQGGQIVYQAPVGFSGTDTFTYTITDGTDTDVATVTVTVGNAKPVAGPGSVSTNTNTDRTFDARTFATDPNSTDTLSITATGTTAHGGTVVRNADGTLTYSPLHGYAGPDSFTYTVSDGHPGGTDTGTISVTVNNAAPVVQDEPVTVPAGVITDVPVLANDTDANTTDQLTVTIDQPPTHGTATVNADGTVKYTPAAGFHGTDSFRYKVSDGHGGEGFGTATLSVVNMPPTAHADADSTDTDTAVTLTVLANDTDPNNDALTVTSNTAPANGTVVVNANGTLTYTPAAGFSGLDSFSYTAEDPSHANATATVTITVRDAAPIAVDDNLVVRPNVLATLDLLGNDADPNTGQVLSVSSVGTAAHGTATLNADGTVTYLTTETSGTDSFTYVLSDGHGLTDTATVHLTIDAAPVAAADAVPTASGTAVDIAVLDNDTDPEAEALTLVSATTPRHGTTAVVGTKVRYTPEAGFFGADTFRYTIRDTAGNTAGATVTVNVGPPATDSSAVVLANHSVDITVADGDKLTVSKVSTPAHGTATIVDGKIRYVPDTGFTGVDTFTYTVTDSNGESATATVTVTVSDGTPVAVNDTRTTPYQKAITIQVLDNDLDPNGELAVTAVTSPDNGTVSFTGSGVVYTPADGFSGKATFTYTATDIDGHETTATVTVTVGAPPVVPDKKAAAKPGKAVKISLPTVDENGNPVTITSVGKAKHGTVKLNGDGTVTYTPDEGYAGIDSFSYEVVDADGNVASAKVDVTVAGANTKPVAKNDKVSVVGGGSIVIKPKANDTDANGDKLTITRIGKPKHGVAVLNANGTVTYAPTDGYSGTDTFSYTVSDGHGGTATATVTITVTAAATGNGSGTGSGGGKLALTGENIVSVASVGMMVLLVGGFLVWFSNRGLPIPAALTDRGHGRHRPGRHRN